MGSMGPKNEALHSVASNQNIIKSLVDDQIQEVYKVGMSDLPHDTLCMLHILLDLQLQKPLATKQQWLDSIQVAKDCKSRHNHGLMPGKQCTKWHFLGLD